MNTWCWGIICWGSLMRIGKTTLLTLDLQLTAKGCKIRASVVSQCRKDLMMRTRRWGSNVEDLWWRSRDEDQMMKIIMQWGSRSQGGSGVEDLWWGSDNEDQLVRICHEHQVFSIRWQRSGGQVVTIGDEDEWWGSRKQTGYAGSDDEDQLMRVLVFRIKWWGSGSEYRVVGIRWRGSDDED